MRSPLRHHVLQTSQSSLTDCVLNDGIWCAHPSKCISDVLKRSVRDAACGVQMEERLRQAELRAKGAQQEAATLRASAQDVAGVQREAALLERELNQVAAVSAISHAGTLIIDHQRWFTAQQRSGLFYRLFARPMPPPTGVT